MGGHAAAERREDSATPGSLVCSEDRRQDRLCGPHPLIGEGHTGSPMGQAGRCLGPGLGGAAAGLRVCFGGDENVLEVDSGSGYLTP